METIPTTISTNNMSTIFIWNFLSHKLSCAFNYILKHVYLYFILYIYIYIYIYILINEMLH